MEFRQDPDLLTVDIEDDGRHLAVLGVPDLIDVEAKSICSEINDKFRRNDDRKTCRLIDPVYKIFEIMITEAEDFAQIH